MVHDHKHQHVRRDGTQVDPYSRATCGKPVQFFQSAGTDEQQKEPIAGCLDPGSGALSRSLSFALCKTTGGNVRGCPEPAGPYIFAVSLLHHRHFAQDLLEGVNVQIRQKFAERPRN